jgi:peptidylprolyl isomerase/peptidyl-prolyl cis-trans isomerase A (cyclophilin A)
MRAMTRTLRSAALAAALLVVPAARAEAPKTKASGDQYAVFVTSRGKIGVKLLPAEAPTAVQNFVELATGKKPWRDPKTGQQQTKAPLYDGTLFHRVIPGFMIQGGDPLTRGEAVGKNYAGFGTGNPGFRFDDELKPGTTPFAVPCQLAMANSGPNTNGSQFFITEVPTPHLNPRPCGESRSGVCGYVHFGQGVCGCEHVAEIARAGNGQTKLEKVEITSSPPTCR